MRFKKILLITLLICLWAIEYGFATPFNILSIFPDSIKNINIPSELTPYLNSNDEASRIFGVIRLGQIGSPKDIGALVVSYDQEPIRTGRIMDISRGVKYYALESIGNIGGELAESTLIAIGQQLWGSATTDSQLIVFSLCHALAQIGSQASYNFLYELYQGKKFPWDNRVSALAGAFSIELKSKTYKTANDSIDYLLSKAPQSGSIGADNMENFIIMQSIEDILSRPNSCNPHSIGYLRSKANDISDYNALRQEFISIANYMQRRWESA